MKKSLLSISILLVSIFAVNAQEFNESLKNKTTFGVKAGLNQTFVSNFPNSLSQGGYYAGAFAETRLSEKISFQYELRYATFIDIGQGDENIYDHSFIEIPLLLKYHFSDKFVLFFGPRMDFLLDDREPAARFGVSVEVGLQYNFNKNFFIEASFSSGLSNQILINELESGSRGILRLGVGYRF